MLVTHLKSNQAPMKISSESRFALMLRAFFFLTGLGALFFLMTNAVPLVQMGWVEDLGKKSRYLRLMLISVPVFAGTMFLAWWKYREIFEKSIWVRLWRAACRVPLRATVPIFFLTYAGIMIAVGFERHLALETRAFDLGIFAQAVWNTLQGDLFFSSIKENINLMGDHVSPILFLTVPFYAIWPDPRTLVLLQALASASSFIPLALIVRDKLKDRSLVLIFLLMYFFYQPMRAALHEDFHPEVLAEPFLWWAFFFLARGKVARFLLCLAVAVTGKENFLGIAFMFGFYALVFKKMWFLGIVVMTASIGIFIWETKWLIPHLTGAKYFYGGNYSAAFADPMNGIVKKLATFESLAYAFKVFLPFLFLPFFHLPTLALTLPVLFQNLITSNPSMRSLNYHYFTGLTPFLFISTIYAIASLRGSPGIVILTRANNPEPGQEDPSPSSGLRMTSESGGARPHMRAVSDIMACFLKKNIRWVVFFLLFVSILRSGPSEYWFFWNIHSHRSAHADMVREKLGEIPIEARVLTHNGLIPQLCNRKFVYQINYNPTPTKIQQAKNYQADILILDRMAWEPNTKSLEETLVEARNAGYVVEFEKDGFFILRKGRL